MNDPRPSNKSSAPPACAFCNADASRIVWAGRLTLALWDAFPFSPGHALLVPRRHAPSWNDLAVDEKAELVESIDAVRLLIAEQYSPDAYNIGFNEGAAAGQTVMHFHVHVIPRYEGDMDDPRGGVRWVLPERAAYWKVTEK